MAFGAYFADFSVRIIFTPFASAYTYMYFRKDKIQGIFEKKKNNFSNRCHFRISLIFTLTQANLEVYEKCLVLYYAQSAHFRNQKKSSVIK